MEKILKEKFVVGNDEFTSFKKALEFCKQINQCACNFWKHKKDCPKCKNEDIEEVQKIVFSVDENGNDDGEIFISYSYNENNKTWYEN